MKRYLLVLVAMLLVVTGCGGKTLNCSTEVDGLTQNVSVKYDGKTIKSIKMVMTYSADDLKELGVTSETIDTFSSLMESYVCATYNSYDGVNCVVTSPNNGLNITIDIEYSKLTDEAKDDLSFNYQGYEELKADLVEQGYTCK